MRRVSLEAGSFHLLLFLLESHDLSPVQVSDFDVVQVSHRGLRVHRSEGSECAEAAGRLIRSGHDRVSR